MKDGTVELEKHYNRLFKITLFISMSNLAVIFWDINGLGAKATSTFLMSKFFFILIPFVFIWGYKNIILVRPLMQPAIALSFFTYSAYYMQTLHYSYFTAFIQFFIGLVLFLKFSTKSFLITYAIGFVLLLLSVDSLQTSFSAIEFEQKSSDIMGAILPVFLVSILVFFLIKKAEEKDDAKTTFFRNIGENVGFLLHEIKQPLLVIKNEVDPDKINEIHELLQISNIMWPGGKIDEIRMKEVNPLKLINDILVQFEKEISLLEISVRFSGDFKSFDSNKQILRIIIKNLVKNAIEANISNEIDEKFIHFNMNENRAINITNSRSINARVDMNKLYSAGYSTKVNTSNKGLGLYITEQLAKKILLKLDSHKTKTTFSMKLGA